MDQFIHIQSAKFPILPGEKDELVNAGTYGKALAQYLQENLTDLGYSSPFVCCEDWGWWVELSDAPFAFGVCIYSRTENDQPLDFVCVCDPGEGRKWSLRRFRFVNTSAWVQKLRDDLLRILRSDDGIRVVGTYDDFPL
jgi:hypothetical protein